MQPLPHHSTLRKVRTFADDIRRAQNGVTGDTAKLTQATSIVAPTVIEHASSPQSPLRESNVVPKGFFGGALDNTLLDIRNSERGTEEATIVTERKAQQWSFTEAITTSFLTWWKETLAELKPVTPEVPRVAVGKRNAIVRAASMNAAIAPKNDSPQLTAGLSGTKVVPEVTAAPVITAPPSPEPVPRWENTEQLTTAIPDVLPVTTTFSPVPKIARPVIRPPITIPSLLQPAETDVPVFREYSSAPTTVPHDTLPETGVSPTIAEDSTVDLVDDSIRLREEAIRDESARFATKARDAALRRKEYEMESQGKNSSKYFVYGTLMLVGVFIVVAVGGIGYSVLSSRHTSSAAAPTPGITMLFDVSVSIAVPLLSNRTDFLVELTKRVKEATGVPGSFLRYYFVYQSDSAKKELPAQAFIDILDLRAPGSFLRTIDEKMMFGAYKGETNAPFLVFKVKNFEDALGGMLLFERNMNSDLAPLFGENLERIGQIGVYRDEVVGGVDTRSLYDQYGNMVITYAFIDKSTLVITTSYSALGALAQVLK